MKRYLAITLLVYMLAGVFAFALSASAEDIRTPTDVPKVIITTNDYVWTEYVSCSVEIIDEEGGKHEIILDESSKIKVRGNSTSSGEKKPYNIKFSGKTDVLGMGKNKKWCLLANCYERTLIRNQTVFDFADSIGLAYTPSYRVVDVYFNNSFLGSYLLTDAVEASETRVDIDNEGFEFILERDARTDEGTTYFTTDYYGIRLGINEPEEPTAEQYDWLMDFIDNAENALRSGDYEEVLKYFDIESMIDFYIVLELFKNVDVDTGSTRFYIKDGKIYGGPCWDFDLSSGNCSSSYYTTYNNVSGSGNSWEGLWCNRLWFRPLLSYPAFKEALCDRYLELQDNIVNLYADNVIGQNHIDKTIETYWGSISRNYNEAGWKIGKVYSELERVPDPTYEENVEFFRTWLENRNRWLLSEWGLDSFIDVDPESDLVQDGFFISGVKEGTTVSELLNKFSGDAYIEYNGATLAPDDIVSNGSTVSVGGASYVLAVGGAGLLGDVNGDGAINRYDYILTKHHYFAASYLTNEEMTRADVNGDGAINQYDYILTKRHCFKTYVIGGNDQ